jgi:lipopolysaccharide/colanic/teichoic acid biosynthesis glycosyltransferase
VRTQDPSLAMDGADRVPFGAGGVLEGARGLRTKRVVEGVVAAVLLVVALPLLAVLALAIVVESRGPVLHRCARVGFSGRPLRMMKLRKMRVGTGGPAVTGAGDPRLTRVGRLMMRTHLDELPQLWHVVRGEMALVGPRPEDPSFVARHAHEYEAILSVRPGLTGLVQVAVDDERELVGAVDPVNFYCALVLPHKVALDQYYATHRSLWLDLRILWWTPIAMLRGLPSSALLAERTSDAVLPEPGPWTRALRGEWAVHG